METVYEVSLFATLLCATTVLWMVFDVRTRLKSRTAAQRTRDEAAAATLSAIRDDVGALRAALVGSGAVERQVAPAPPAEPGAGGSTETGERIPAIVSELHAILTAIRETSAEQEASREEVLARGVTVLRAALDEGTPRTVVLDPQVANDTRTRPGEPEDEGEPPESGPSRET